MIIAIESLDNFYSDIVNALKVSAAQFESKSKSTGDKHVHICDLNDHVRELYSLARDSFLEWVKQGKPRFGLMYDHIKNTRANFKYNILSNIVRNNRIYCSVTKWLLTCLIRKRMLFWHLVKDVSKSNNKISSTVEGCNGASNIGHMWRDHYSDIFNSVNDVSARDEVPDHLNSICEMTHFVTVDDVHQCVFNLVKGKACGEDGLFL